MSAEVRPDGSIVWDSQTDPESLYQARLTQARASFEHVRECPVAGCHTIVASTVSAGQADAQWVTHITDNHRYLGADQPLDEGWVEQGRITVIRALDADGRRRITTRYDGDVMWWEALGMLRVATIDAEAERTDVPNA